jgi:RNA 3'-terminal phosphate cyclase
VSDNPLIEVRDLVVRRGTFALEVPGWRVEPGQVIGVVGPNGAGKTTLLETLAGLRPANAGTVRVLGRDPWREPEVRAALGFASDDMPVFDLRVAPLLRLLSGYYPTWDAALAESLLERFKLDTAARAHTLSKGQGTVVFLWADFENAAAGFTSLGERGKPAERVAEEAASELVEFLHGSAALDRHLADQLVLPMALAAGPSQFTTERVTQHLLTNAWVVNQFFPGRVRVEGVEGTPGALCTVGGGGV